MTVNKRINQLNKKGASIISVLTKAESDLESHIADSNTLIQDISFEIKEKEVQQAMLKDETAQYSKVLGNIKTLLGK